MASTQSVVLRECRRRGAHQLVRAGVGEEIIGYQLMHRMIRMEKHTNKPEKISQHVFFTLPLAFKCFDYCKPPP